MTLENLKEDLQELSNPQKAKLLSGFFKTGPGQYGEGDIFLGIVVPKQREVAKKYQDLRISDVQKLIKSPIHEERLIALFILIFQFNNNKNNPKQQEVIYHFYLKNAKKINNWDLVDLSAPKIMGEYLLNKKKDREVLYKLAKSKNLWEKRIAILSTFTFIKNHDFKDSIKISESLLLDTHDLIHKAVGWMLREIGKRDKQVEEKFLKKYVKKMPRTALRYAIERFPEAERLKYLQK